MNARPHLRHSPLAQLRVASALLALGLLGLGCAQELEQSPPPSTTASGRLTINGQPAGRGWIEFQPVEGAIGLLRTSPVSDDGSFQASRLPIGNLAIRFIPAAPRRTGDPRLDFTLSRLEQAYAIRRTVQVRQSQPLLIDLAEEAALMSQPSTR